MILLLKYNNKNNICFFNGGFIFSVFILWFWLFCGFCALISMGVIWWASGFLLRFDFRWVLAMVVVVIWFWLGFGSGVWLEVMSLKSSGYGGLEGEVSGQPMRAWWSAMEHGVTWVETERGWEENRGGPRHLGPKARTKNEIFFILIY